MGHLLPDHVPDHFHNHDHAHVHLSAHADFHAQPSQVAVKVGSRMQEDQVEG